MKKIITQWEDFPKLKFTEEIDKIVESYGLVKKISLTGINFIIFEKTLSFLF